MHPKNKPTAIVIAAVMILCSACASTSTGFGSGSVGTRQSSLSAWLNETAGPELAALLGEHPMFKNEQFLIAALSKEEIIPVRDDVTRQIRESLIAALLNKPGVALAWRPDAEQAVAFEDLSDPGSRQLSKIRYYIGIETGIDPLDGMLSVQLRILNVDEKKWVPGIHLCWRGSPTEGQKQALLPHDAKQYTVTAEPAEDHSPQPEIQPVPPASIPEPGFSSEPDRGFD